MTKKEDLKINRYAPKETQLLTGGVFNVVAQAMLGLLEIFDEEKPSTEKIREKLKEALTFLSGVIVATTNTKKVDAFYQLIGWLGVIRGQDVLPINYTSTGAEEPPDEYALAVAWSKVEAVVKKIVNGSLGGGSRLIVGTDVVVSVNGHYLLNLSRINDEELDRKKLDEREELLTELYNDGGVIGCDVAMAYSIKPPNGKVIQGVVANKIKLHLKPVSGDVISRFFSEQKVGQVKNINAGVPIVDGDGLYHDYVTKVEIFPSVVFENNYQGEWMSKLEHPLSNGRPIKIYDLRNDPKVNKEKVRQLLEVSIIGGVPPAVFKMLERLAREMGAEDIDL